MLSVYAGVQICRRGLVIVGALVLAACNAAPGAGGSNYNPAPTTLVIEPMSEIPLVDGQVTTTGIYVHNYGESAIYDIHYASHAINGKSELLFPKTSACMMVAAHSSCLLPVTLPEVAPAARGSWLISAYFAKQQSSQLLNYRYVAAESYSGINFGGEIQINAATGDDRYVSTYVFAGNHQAFRSVKFYTLDSDGTSVGDPGLAAVDIPADTLVPVEIKINSRRAGNPFQLIAVSAEQNTANPVLPAPTSAIRASSALQSQTTSSNILQVIVLPTATANLLLSNLPVMSAAGESRVNLTIVNNGVAVAGGLNLTSLSSDLSVVNAASNTCSTTLASGASCNFQLNLQNTTSNGSALISLEYNNGVNPVTATQNVYISNSPQFPMLAVTNLQSYVWVASTLSIFYSDVTIQNLGNAPLNSLALSFQGANGILAGSSFASNSCSDSLAAGSSCKVSISVTTATGPATGYAYLGISGNYAGQNYSFASKSSQIKVAALTTVAYVTDTQAHNVYRCLINLDGSIQNCTISNGDASGSSWTPFMISSNSSSYVYVGNNQTGGNNIYRCGVDNGSSSLSNCSAGNNGMASGAQPTGIAINGSYGYVLDYQHALVYRCSIESNGGLANCTQTGSGLNSGLNAQVYNIAFNESHVYVTDPVYDNVYVAVVNSDGTLGAFTYAQNGISAYGITFHRAANGSTYAYIASVGVLDNHVYRCAIAGDATLINCSNVLSSGESADWEPSALAFYNNSAYVTDEGNNKIAVCPLNNDGSFASCSESSFGVSGWNPHSLTIVQYYKN